MIPDRLPFITKDVSKHLIIGLTRQDVTVRFNTHVIQGSGATLDSQIKGHGVKVAIVGRGVPDQSLSAFFGEILGEFKEGKEFVFGKRIRDRTAASRENEGI